jgi:hypothetical protein
MEIPSEIDTSNCEGLTRLLRFAIGLRENDTDRAAVQRLESRFGLATYEPQFRGALEDFAHYLDGLGHNQRFATVCALIAAAIEDSGKLSDELVGDILKTSSNKRIVRFSFAQCLLPCLLHARATRQQTLRTYSGCEIRYAGVGADRELMAFASLFLDLPIYTESNPPWDPDPAFEDDEPNAEPPELEISFPPANFLASNAPHLEASVRKSGLPRAVDRGRYDLESVMLAYLCDGRGAAFVFASEDFLASTKQSRLVTRQRLLDMLRIRQVLEMKMPQPRQFMLELSPVGTANETVWMVSTDTVQQLSRAVPALRPVRGKSVQVSVDEIRSAGDCLKPARYIGTGAAGGRDFAERIHNILNPTEYRLADIFDVVRPKTTKHDPVGTLKVQEVRSGNISANGEILGALRTINVRSTLAGGLEEQMIKPGDILFAHRSPIGHVAYITNENIPDGKTWAGQSVLIFRARKRTSASRNIRTCDPRVLFMYLMTPDVRRNWANLATGDRSPAIPIGQIESLSLPENLLVPEQQQRGSSIVGTSSSGHHTNLILSQFEDRQRKLMKLREIQTSMDDGLSRVWQAAWSG